ncbi:MAG: SGNH/GDSL hydrolase family protein [Bradymonadia bacterium]
MLMGFSSRIRVGLLLGTSVAFVLGCDEYSEHAVIRDDAGVSMSDATIGFADAQDTVPDGQSVPSVDTQFVDAAADDGGDNTEIADQAFTDDEGDVIEPAIGQPIYRADRVHSNLSPEIVMTLHSIRDRDDGLQNDVFLKAGASSTVSTNTLHCFAGNDVDLGEYDELRETLEFFLDGNAAGSSPFDRETVAARVGHSASWVIDGDPAPIDSEIDAIAPRFALLHYGTNDMGLGSTYASAARVFHDSMMTLVDTCTEQGIIPILFGISPRGDRPEADHWVRTYNAIIRGIAQTNQIPFVDIYHATRDLVNYGLSEDGIHLNRYGAGSCILTEDGLNYGYNVRNLVALQALDRVRRSVFDGDSEDAGLRLGGLGSTESPFVVQSLPFAHGADTAMSTNRRYDQYSVCSDANESGPEFVYQFSTDQPRRVRAMVFDSGRVDIDLHLLGADPIAEACIARDHHQIETTLDPGTYHFVLDTFTDRDGNERSGPYLFVLLECDEDDSACD